MDIFLDTIQGICEDMHEYEDMEMSLVIDRDGLVVAHSDQNEIGKNYSTDGIAFHKNKMWVSEKLTNILAAGHYSLTRVDEIVKAIATESSRSLLEQFMDFSTVADRLKHTKSISHDFLDIDNHWTRMHFIAGQRDKNGDLQSVIWATESIDEDRRRQEELREKAETDALTKILNRRGGEIRLYEVFEKRLFDNIERVTISGVYDWKLHVSVGATFCNPDVCISFDEYFKQADTAMYNSKQREGNQLTFFENNDKT